MPLPRRYQVGDGVVDSFVGEYKAAEMHADGGWVSRSMCAQRVIGVHVLVAHALARLVGPDRQECQVHAPQACANVTEVFPVSGVICEIPPDAPLPAR
jgi:hypothetical protein